MDCNHTYPSIFNTTSSLTLSGLDLLRCDYGIAVQFDPDVSTGRVEVNDCYFEDFSIIIFITNGAAYIENSEFSSARVAIESAYSFINATSCEFKDISHFSLVAVNSTGNIIYNSQFTRAAMVTIAQSTERTTSINNCTWDESPSRAISLVGGLFNFGYSTIMNSEEEYGDGGAVAVYQAMLDMDNVQIVNTSSHGNGGALFCSECNSLDVSGCNFTNNYATSNGGAVYVSCGLGATFSDSVFNYNNASEYGGGIALNADNCSFVASFDGVDYFTGNRAAYGAAVGCCGNASACGATIEYPSDALQLVDNVNDDGSDNSVGCVVAGDGDGSGSDSGDNPETNYTDPWVWVGVGIGLVLVIIAAVAAGILAYWIKEKKSSSYDEIY